jgi:hypothetical protein
LRNWVWHRYYRVLEPSSGYMYLNLISLSNNSPQIHPHDYISQPLYNVSNSHSD